MNDNLIPNNIMRKNILYAAAAAILALAGMAVEGCTPTHNGPECVLMGDSITEQWLKYRPEFFENNGFVGAGISGQVTGQILARFDDDVVARDPKTVSILCGINDIAQNQGYISNEDIAKNIGVMIDKAKAAKIRVILWSVLPSDVLCWKREIDPAPLVKDLNIKLKALAKEKGVTYVDFYSDHVTETGGLPADLTTDGVHVTAACYELMEQILLDTLSKK